MEIDSSKSLFVAGHAKVTILEGKCEVFGYPYEKNAVIEVEENRSAPFKPLTDKIKVRVELGENGYISYVEGDLIPESWRKIAEEISSLSEKVVVMVIGRVDVGKTGFLTFLANILLQKNKKVAVVDADTGQSSIGPPTTVGLGFVENPLIYLNGVKFVDAYFVGSTTPSGVFNRSVVGVFKMVKKAFDMDSDVVIVDTTGWVDDKGRELKISKVDLLRPDFLVLIESEFGDLFHIAKPFLFSGMRIRNITPPPTLRARSRETRREIRRSIFKGYLEDGEIKEFPITTVNLRYSYIGTGKVLTEDKLSSFEIEVEPNKFYMEYSKDVLLIYQKESNTISPEITEKLKQALEVNNVLILNKDSVENILVALKDTNDTFLGLGIIKDFDPETRTLKIYTKVDAEKVKTIEFGHIKANEEGEELGHVYPWSI